MFRITIGKRPKLNPSEHLLFGTQAVHSRLRTHLSHIIQKPLPSSIHGVFPPHSPLLSKGSFRILLSFGGSYSNRPSFELRRERKRSLATKLRRKVHNLSAVMVLLHKDVQVASAAHSSSEPVLAHWGCALISASHSAARHGTTAHCSTERLKENRTKLLI